MEQAIPKCMSRNIRRSSTGMFALAIALIATTGSVRAAEDAKYPNWKGQWAQILTRVSEARM
jgi:hypothetical protein